MQELGSALSNVSGSQTATTENVTDGQQNIIQIISDLASLLSYYTKPTQNKSILPLDIGSINSILSSFLMLVNSSNSLYSMNIYIIILHIIFIIGLLKGNH